MDAKLLFKMHDVRWGVGCWQERRVQEPDPCSACSSAVVDAVTAATEAEEHPQRGVGCWQEHRTQMPDHAQCCLGFGRCRHQKHLVVPAPTQAETGQQGVALADASKPAEWQRHKKQGLNLVGVFQHFCRRTQNGCDNKR